MPVYNINELTPFLVGEAYSPSKGVSVEGERIIFARVLAPAGSKAASHYHPNEQFVIVISGRGRYVIEENQYDIGPGDIVHIPINAVHSMEVFDGEDMVFVTAKDTSWGIQGKLATGN